VWTTRLSLRFHCPSTFWAARGVIGQVGALWATPL
jgi:hypothetical protein